MPSDDLHEQRVERERAFHDERYADDQRGVTEKYYAVDDGRAAFAAALDAVPRGARVLEYGCGTGSSAFDLAARGVDVTGIDISTVAIAAAVEEAARRGLSERLRFVQDDAHGLSQADASFDVVCGSGVLHHLDLDRALPEIARVLDRDGWAVFYEPLGSNPIIGLYRRLTPKLRTPDEHPLLPRDLALARRSFEVVEASHHTALALFGVVLRRLPGGARAVAALHRADRWLFRVVPPTRWLAWVVVLRLSKPIRAGAT
jgi:SAM-dependent methyltransferase